VLSTERFRVGNRFRESIVEPVFSFISATCSKNIRSILCSDRRMGARWADIAPRSGSRSFLYGSTRRHLLSVTVALMDGTVRTYGAGEARFRVHAAGGAALPEAHAGYYLRRIEGTRVICGSEARCGGPEAEVRLLPQPRAC